MMLARSMLLAAVLLGAAFVPLSAQEPEPFLYEIRPLFENGEHLKNQYRFRNVALIQCPNGDLLAFVEARHEVNDHSEKDVLMRRSKDRGLSWGPYEEVWGLLEEDNAGGKDPAPVVDETTGRLFYFMNTNETEKRLFYMTSDDSGYSWSDPIRIPDSLLKPEWKRWRNNPGPGIQLKIGTHKHRICGQDHRLHPGKRFAGRMDLGNPCPRRPPQRRALPAGQAGRQDRDRREHHGRAEYFWQSVQRGHRVSARRQPVRSTLPRR